MEKAREFSDRSRLPLLITAALGLLTFLIALLHSPQRAWANLLLANLYFVQIALFGLLFVALEHIFSAGWAVVFRRIPEAMSAYLPIGGALMLALVFGYSHLYPWSRPEVLGGHHLIRHNAAYLNFPFFFARMVVALGIWIFFSYLLRYHSRRQDEDGDITHTRKNQAHSAAFLLLFTVTFIFASIDWVMSLEPKWYSTIFPAYLSAGLLLGGSAALSVLLVHARREGLVPGINDNHVYELSRIICATSTFWAYIWFSQYMLIYYANIPEEAVYFARRLAGGWSFLFLLNPALNWFIPLALLIPASARRSPRWLFGASIIALMGRWLDMYLLIMPALGRAIQFGLTEIFVFTGLLALFLLALFRSFAAGQPLPRHDPYLVESVNLRVLDV